MKKNYFLKTFMLLLCLFMGISTWAQDASYILDATLAENKGTNNGYETSGDVTVSDITWNAQGNITMSPWRIGGKSLSSKDRVVYSKTAYANEVSKIDLTVGAASSITVNSLKLIYSTNSDFSNSSEISKTFAANSTISFEADFPANAYYKFVFNVSVSVTSNKFVEFKKVEFYNKATGDDPAPSGKELIGIQADGTPAEFWKGDAFNHNGITVTALWDDETETDVTSSCTFTGYDMTASGQQEVTVTYQEETTKYNIQVKTIANTQAEAYTVAEAKALIDAGKDLSTSVYVAGTVSQVDSYSDQYKSITYWISTDGTTTNQFEVYSGKNLNNTDFSAVEEVQVGDQVVIYGVIKKYSSTYEFDKNNYIVSLTRPAAKTITALTVSGTPTKTEYYAGDAFETAGLVVTGYYSDGTNETITEGIEWTIAPEELALGTTSVDVIAGVGAVVSEVYTVNDISVTKPDFETVTYNFSSFTSGANVELTNLDGFVIALKSNGGTNPAWSSNQARVYAKGSLTVKANNATIKSIEYTYVVNANNKGVTPTIDGVAGKTTAGAWDAENKTWTGEDEEVTFSTSGSAGNVGFTKLVIKYTESSKINTSLAWSADDAEVTIGADDNVFPTLTTTPVDLAGVTYESSNTEVATIAADGTITLVKAGETTITANYTGDAEHAAASPASYTLTVNKAPFVPTPAPEGYETVDFTTLEPYASLTGSQSANVEDYEGTSFSMAFAKPQSSTTPSKYYNSGASVRAYTGNTITINGAENITYVDITWTAEKGEDTGVSITGLGTKTAVVTFSKTCSFSSITVAYGAKATIAVNATAQYGTFCAPFAVEVPEGVTASTATLDGETIVLASVGETIPANTPVVLYAEEGLAATNVYGREVAGTPEAGVLTGVYEETPAPVGSYVLQLQNEKVGFYHVEDVQPKVGANRAYLTASASASARAFFFDAETAISTIESLTSGKAEIYNLNGVKLNGLQKGINIVNGKKVMVK